MIPIWNPCLYHPFNTCMKIAFMYVEIYHNRLSYPIKYNECLRMKQAFPNFSHTADNVCKILEANYYNRSNWINKIRCSAILNEIYIGLFVISGIGVTSSGLVSVGVEDSVVILV